MALMIQKLVRAQQSQQQLLTLQGSCQLFGLRHLSDAPPVKSKNQGLGNSRAEGTAPRFYKYVGVEPAPGQGNGWQITLNDRALKTPARQPLIVPSYPLALGIAAEWEWQDNRIRPFTMPLMSLAATAIDQPKPRQKVTDTMLQYLDTDAICCREEPGKLANQQAKVYNPVLVWANQQFDVKFAVSNSIFGAHQNADTHQAVRQFLQGLDDWHLAAMESLASSCRSVVLALAVMHGQLDVQAAITAARLEETYQMDEWGLVEGGHDIDIADMQVRIAGPAVFLRLLKHA
ncbi:TPA: hypothetical protein ACH3X3_001684 [Trebouxia sp. C0006]